MIQWTSLDSFNEIKVHLGDLQQQVYDVLEEHPNSSNHDLSRLMGKPINCITPRVKELRDLGLIVNCGFKKDDVTFRNVLIWKVINDG